MAVRGGYLGRSPGDSAVIVAKQDYAATGVQTSFAFDSLYTPGYVDVYFNGVRLIDNTDYTATDGQNVDLATNAVSGDVIEIVAYKAFNVGDVQQAGYNFTVKNNLNVTGVSTFTGDIDANANIDVASNLNVSGVSTLSGNIKSDGKLTINPDDGSTSWQRELDTIHQIRDDIYLQSTLNVGDKAGFDFTPLAISAFSYSGTTLTLTTAAHTIKVGANVLIKDSASGFSEAFNTISGTTGTTIKVTRSSDPSSSLSTANTKVTVYTPVDPRGCINVAKDHDKFDENSFNPILRGFVGRDLDTAAGVNTEAFKLELKKDSSASDHVATLLHSTREFGAGQRIALTIDDGESYPDGKNLVLTQNGVKITADDSAFTDSVEILEVEGNAEVDGTLNVVGITTGIGGFVSAASTSACKITFSGQTLTFNVPGVGSTTLTLY